MKNSKFVWLLAFIVSLTACQKEPTPLEVINLEPPVGHSSPLEIDTMVFVTKEPSVPIPDPGFEACLLIMGIDKDNQINGKVAKEDVETVTQMRLVFQEISRNNKKFNSIYNRYGQYATGQTFQIKSFEGLGAFTNLIELVIHNDVIFFGYGDNMLIDLSQNVKLESFIFNKPVIKYLNFSGCKKLKRLDMSANITASFMPWGNHYAMEYLELSTNTELEYLALPMSILKVDLTRQRKLKTLLLDNTFNLKTLNIQQSKHLESISIVGAHALNEVHLAKEAPLVSLISLENKSLKEIAVPKEVFARVDTMKHVEYNGYTPPKWYKDSWTAWKTLE